MKTSKTVFTKLFAGIFAILLAAGCASVTDANTDISEPTLEKVTVTQSSDTWDSQGGDDMDPLIEEPDMNE
ncbi:MAG: hypothetical protein WD604_09620 [Balneolaceae bacterium]